jgi:hypothetical protein
LIIATLPATGEADGDRYARERRLGPSQKANRALDPILVVDDDQDQRQKRWPDQAQHDLAANPVSTVAESAHSP